MDNKEYKSIAVDYKNLFRKKLQQEIHSVSSAALE